MPKTNLCVDETEQLVRKIMRNIKAVPQAELARMLGVSQTTMSYRVRNTLHDRLYEDIQIINAGCYELKEKEL